MSRPHPPRPSSHRAVTPPSAFVRRLLPPLGAVTAVVTVILLLLVLNSRPSSSGPGPGAVAESPAGHALTATAPTPSSSPTRTADSAPAPPVSEPQATQSAATPLASKSTERPPVTVLNNSRRQGLAAHVAAEVAGRGWTVRETGNFRGRVIETTAYYAAGQRGAAEALARQFPQIRRVEPRFAGLPGAGLTIVVTRDWSG